MSQLLPDDPAQTLSTLQAYSTAMRRQIAAMESLQRTSDRLLDSISHGDTASLTDILSQRAEACQELSRVFSAVSPGIDVAQLARSEQPEIRSAAAELELSRRRVESLKEQTLTVQQKCEAALRTALDDIKRQLREKAGQRKVMSVYQMPPPGPPRFLDRRK